MKRAEPGALIEVRRILTDEASSCPPALFPSDRTVASNPGLYSWWSDGEARQQIGTVLHSEVPPLIYVGQAGATQWPSARKSAATLASRIRSNHINGNASSSTFLLSISAILMDPLELSVVRPGRLDPDDRKRISAWIKEHLKVSIAPCADRDSLEDLEKQLLAALDPPLNLQGMPSTPIRTRLSQL